MQLAGQLKAAGLGVFPCAVNYNYSKQKWEKHPLTVRGESWANTAQRPLADSAVNWGNVEVLGLPIPAGVVVIDLDTYREGCNTEAADILLGTALPWAQALIQTTISGGAHYAFRLPGWTVKQGSNIGAPGSGIDTRVAGLGFICSGRGYTAANSFGVMRMAYPESLPVLPDECRAALEAVAPVAAPRAELPTDDRETTTVQAALRHIDPSERDTWRDIGFALKHHYHDDIDTGFTLWDAWSAGEYWPGGCPAGYASETQRPQWEGFRAVRDGATITIGSLFHKAMQGGWAPPARFDTAAAFGEGAAPVETFNALVTRISEHGADPRQVEELLAAITTSGCNEIQALLLRNELKAIMRSAKLLDKDMGALIDRKTAPQGTPTAPGLYGQNDTDNAVLFLGTRYPDGTLIKCDGEFYHYTGKIWEKLHIDVLRHIVATDMAAARMQASRINTCTDLVCKLTAVYDGGMNHLAAHLIIFDNGVLDTNTGVLGAHNKRYLTTNLLPYDYSPHAVCPQWLGFLNEVLNSDPENIALLQEWMGYLLASDYRHHKIMLLLGPRRCGKGTIGRILHKVVGDANFSGGSLTSFAADSFLDSLRTKPVLFIGDAEKRVAPAKINQVIERIKSISGNDAVAFDRKFISALSETIPTRITVAANSVPNLFDDSGALASRLLLLAFTRSFYGSEDLQLAERLLTELPGIAAWALVGLRRIQTNGKFTEPVASQSEMQYISEAYSPLTRFLNEACVFGGGSECTSTSLYNSYRAWCLAESEDILKNKTFIGAVKDATRGGDVSYGVHRLTDGTVGRGFKGVQPAHEVPSVSSAFQPVVVK